MADDEEDTRWCDCDSEKDCYGGAKFWNIKCRFKSTSNGRVPFLKRINPDLDEED